jgi:uncharacterized membrane protein
MAFCANCGAQVDGGFCPACGKPVGGAAPPPVPPAAAPAAGMQDNVAATLAYVLGFVTGIIFLVLEPYNKSREVRFHAFQSIFLSVGLIAIHIVLGWVGTALFTVSLGLGTAVMGLLSLVISLGSLALWLFLLFKTYNGVRIVLPVIGPLAEKQAG